VETSELIKKVRKIEIKTRGLSKQLFSGEYHSAFKGRGMAFSEVREYFPGDEIRTIDWNVTARSGTPHIKVFEEERELTVMLIVDISGSENFGTQTLFKRELITELCAVIAFSAMQNNDKVGLILFSDQIEKFIPPKKGKSHVLRIIRELIEFKAKSKKTNIDSAVRYFSNVVKKRSIAFILSDFIDDNFEQSLKIASRKHDTVAIKVYDKSETEVPNLGLVQLKDFETGKFKWVDTSSKKFREEFKKWWTESQVELEQTLLKNKIDLISISTDESYIAPLQQFFKRREGRK